jgi:ATP-binding cassette, subfamily B, bacterial
VRYRSKVLQGRPRCHGERTPGFPSDGPLWLAPGPIVLVVTTTVPSVPSHAGPGDDFEPLAVERRYSGPKATIDPDRSKGWLRRLAPIVGGHRWLLVASIASSAAGLVAQVAVPAVLSVAIDNALIDRTEPLSRYLWILVGLALARGIFAFGSRYGLFRMAYRIETDLRSVIYRHLTRLSFSFFDRVQSGQIISRANSDIRSVQMFLGFAPLISMSVLSFFLALGFMLTISIPLTVVAVVTLPGVYVVGVLLRNRVFPLSWIVQGRMADVATIVDENVNGVRVVKSFAAEQRQINQLAKAARRLQWANLETIDTRARLAPLMENLPRIGLVAVLLYGGQLVIDGQIQLGALVAFNAYILMMQTPFRLLGFFLMLQHRARASAERIFEILDESPDVVERPGAIDLVYPSGRVELRNVRFGYGDGPDVLCGLDLLVEPGETIAVVGRTGSGKSTLARLLPRFYDVRDGAVLIDGHDVRDLTLRSLRAHIGVVLDEAFLFSISVHDNIAYGRPDASRQDVIAAAIAAQAHDFVTELPDGYDTVLGERGYTLSGGQRQRVALARALLVNPRILVLDDATSAIDVHVEEAIHLALGERLVERTTIVIAHRLSTISLADRVVLLEGGRVVASGTHQALMATEPRYAAVLAHLDDEEVA